MSNVSSSCFRLILLFFMVIQNSSVVLVGRYTRASQTNENLYVVNHLIMVIETMKLILASIFELKSTEGRLYQSLKEHVFDHPMDCIKILIPSLLYLLQNYLLYVALSNLSAPFFQVTYQSKILTTAIVSGIMLNRKYNVKQWICLTILGFGVATVVLGEQKDGDEKLAETVTIIDLLETNKSKQRFWGGLIAVTCACFCSALAGVYFEMVLKKPVTSADATKKPASLWMRNIQMAFFSVCIAYLQFLFLTGEDGQKPFMYGFTVWVWLVAVLQAGGGLLVAAVIKYADNVLKGMATGVSVVLGTACSMVLFDTPLTKQFIIGASMILFSVYFFNNDLPKSQKKDFKKDGSDIEMQTPLVRNT